MSGFGEVSRGTLPIGNTAWYGSSYSHGFGYGKGNGHGSGTGFGYTEGEGEGAGSNYYFSDIGEGVGSARSPDEWIWSGN